jgi:hypothetical protein
MTLRVRGSSWVSRCRSDQAVFWRLPWVAAFPEDFHIEPERQAGCRQELSHGGLTWAPGGG